MRNLTVPKEGHTIGYRKIKNLYKDQTILMFRECYAMEKIHGTSASVQLKYKNPIDEPELIFFSGGEKHVNFLKLFDHDALLAKLKDVAGGRDITVFGEAYGGKQQGMSGTYGKELCFIAFEVKIGETWLNVPNSEAVVKSLGLEFVPYKKIPATVEALNIERDRPSRVAKRRGIEEDKVSEGVVVKPLVEVRLTNGDRVIAKHKGEAFSERKSKRDTVVDPEKMKVLTKAKEIAEEWVTPMRLEHVLDKLEGELGPERTRDVIVAMTEDIKIEGAGEFVDSKEARKAIGTAVGKMFNLRLKRALSDK